MEIHRSHPEKQFTIIPDVTVRDPRLSYRARGVLAEILSRPDDWATTADGLWRRARYERGPAGEGRNAMRAVYAELEAAGYLYRYRHRGVGGRFTTEMHLFDAAQELQPDGRPLFFTLTEQLEADNAAGRTDDGTGGRRSHLGKSASSQVAPTTDYRASADRASADRASADRASADRASIQRPSTETYTEIDTKIFNGDRQHEDAEVLKSPVPVESRPARSGQDREKFDQVRARSAGEPVSNASGNDEQLRRRQEFDRRLAELIQEHPGASDEAP